MKPTCGELKKILEYDASTGVFKWRIDLGSAVAGDIAGYTNTDGYVRIKINGKFYQAHRLAWLYVTGDWPPAKIDHANRVRNDNRWLNLRAATTGQNNANSVARSSSGHKSVVWSKRDRIWLVMLKSNSKVLRGGRYPCLLDAVAAAIGLRQQVHGDFSGQQNQR